MRLIVIISIVLLPVVFFSQSREQYNSKFTIRGCVGIPKPISSQMYAKSFTGFAETNLSANLRLFGNFYAGLGYQYSHFQNNKKVFVYYTAPVGSKFEGENLSYDTRLAGHGLFVKLGIDKFFKDKAYMSYALNSGVMLAGYLNVVQDSAIENQPFVSTSFTTPFVQPEVTVNFIVEPRLSFCVLLSYTTLFYHYDPKAPRFAGFGEIAGASNNYVMSWFNIGFGFNILLGSKR